MLSRWVPTLLAAGLVLTGCSTLSGADDSDRSFSAPPTHASPTPRAIDAQFGRTDVAKAVLADARKDLTAVFALDYRHLGTVRDAGLAASTGDYADTYRSLFVESARTALRKAEQIQLCTITVAGLAGLSDQDHRATVFAVLSVSTQSKALSVPSTRTLRGLVTLEHVDARWRISKLEQDAVASGTVPADSDLARAEHAARTSVTTLLTLTRKKFDGQYTAGLRLQTGTLLLRSQLDRASAKGILDKGDYDVSTKVAGLSVVSAAGTRVQLLLNVRQYRTFGSGARFGPYPVTLRVTTEYQDGSWLLSASDTV